MKRLSLLLGALLLTGCATVKVPNHKVYVTLPATGDGYSIETLTAKEERIPKAVWDEKIKRGIVLMSEDWAKIKKAFGNNCMRNKECKQVTGALDELFETIDQTLGVVLPK